MSRAAPSCHCRGLQSSVRNLASLRDMIPVVALCLIPPSPLSSRVSSHPLPFSDGKRSTATVSIAAAPQSDERSEQSLASLEGTSPSWSTGMYLSHSLISSICMRQMMLRISTVRNASDSVFIDGAVNASMSPAATTSRTIDILRCVRLWPSDA